MTMYDYLAFVLLILAIGVNSLTVYLQKTKGIYNRFGSRALLIHSLVISFFWGIFIISEFLLAKSSWKLEQNYPVLGLAIMAGALLLFVAALRQIGRGALGNANFFGGATRQLKGVYDYVPEPIYVSYCLWFFGIGLATGLKGFFVITLIAAVGLLVIEARVESVDVAK